MKAESIKVSDLENMPVPTDLKGLVRDVLEANKSNRYSMMLPTIGVAMLIQRIVNLESLLNDPTQPKPTENSIS